MTSPAPSDGERPTDEQSETVSAPSNEGAPPVRQKRTGVLAGGLLLLWIALGVLLVVAAVAVLG